MRRNRIVAALIRLNRPATVSEIAAAVHSRGNIISAQISGMERRGMVRRVGTRMIRVRRWTASSTRVSATLWTLEK